MSVETIAARLASIQAAITGIVTAYGLDEIPNALRSAQLPAFINVPGEATHVQIADDLLQETRTWYMLLFLAPVEAPVQVAQRMSLARPFFARVRDAFAARDGLESLSGVLRSAFLGDNGVTAPLEFGGTMYSGIEFRLQTLELVQVAAVDYT